MSTDETVERLAAAEAEMAAFVPAIAAAAKAALPELGRLATAAREAHVAAGAELNRVQRLASLEASP